MNKIVHYREQKYDVYIGRPSKWGNPFIIGRDGGREAVIKKYEEWILQKPDLLNDLTELDGKVLGCWCKTIESPNTSCHGDVLVKLLEQRRQQEISKNKILGVVGSRVFNNYNYLKEKLDLHKPKAIVSGGAEGADTLAQKYAKEEGLAILIYYPDWKLHGKGAGFRRNEKVVKRCEELVAFTNGSKGTQDSIDRAKRLNKKVYIYSF